VNSKKHIKELESKIHAIFVVGVFFLCFVVFLFALSFFGVFLFQQNVIWGVAFVSVLVGAWGFCKDTWSILGWTFSLLEAFINLICLQVGYSRVATMPEYFFVKDYISPQSHPALFHEISLRPSPNIYWSDYWKLCKEKAKGATA